MSVDENGYVIEPEELELEPESSYFVVLTSELAIVIFFPNTNSTSESGSNNSLSGSLCE